MLKYLKLLRLPDQWILLYPLLITGITLKPAPTTLWWWTICIILLSCTAFMTNELIDRNDVDKHSWNPIHVNSREKYNTSFITIIYISFLSVAFLLAYKVRLLSFASIIFMAGQLYSLPPIRLKSRFGLDLLTQVFVWWILPFAAMAYTTSKISDWIPLIVSFSLITLSIFLPYQLADFLADRKAKLQSTHIIIGMHNSLILGIVAGFLGVLIFLLANDFWNNQWFWYFFVAEIYFLYLYCKWYKLKDLKSQTLVLQKSVRQIRPFSYLLIPYLLFWYFVK